jgi:hypothetical protein
VTEQSPFDIHKFQTLLKQGQYADACTMLEAKQHPALDELKHRAKIKKSFDSMYIDDIEIHPQDVFNLIQVVKRTHTIEISIRLLLITMGAVVLLVGAYTIIAWLIGRPADPSNLCAIPSAIFLIYIGTLRTPEEETI